MSVLDRRKSCILTAMDDDAKKRDELDANKLAKLSDVYGAGEEGKAEWEYAQKLIQQVNEDLELREKSSMISNGVSYTQGYAYNQRKAINYAPPRQPKDDRQVSMGLVHEKIISFIAIFLKYVFKRRIKCYDNNGNLIKGMGAIYDLGIEFSYKLEQFKKKIALIYWEVFTQGNAFVLEDWEVKLRNNPIAYKNAEDGKKVVVTPDNMDYTYEFLDGLSYEKGEPAQYRRAVSRVLDGRQVIFGNPEIEDIQEQPRITIETEMSRADAEQIYGTLSRWSKIPKTTEDITAIVGTRTTIFGATRHKNPDDVFIEHKVYDKENNKFNVYLNGVMMLPRATPMTLFYPRGNYAMSNIPCERLRGSIYARSIPAKTKFNADFVDWALKMLANKFEQGIDPAILSKGKYTLTRDMFRGGQVTHGVSREDFEKADPENNGVTQPEFNFVAMLKDIIQTQTINPTTSGELSSSATATEIATVDNNQRDKLGFLLDGLMTGFMDMALRRAETIESKYTIKQKETIVDGKTVPVYQNFTVNVSGIENVVVFDEAVGTENYDEQGKKDELFEKSFNEKKKGYATEYYLANPIELRKNMYVLDIEITPERIKDSQLQMIQMWDEFGKLLEIFGREEQGGSISTAELKKEYLEVSGKPDEIFTSQMYQQLDKEKAAMDASQGQPGGGYNMGSFGKPTVKAAQQQQMGTAK